MSFALQAKLLRFLQERKYCRVGSTEEESADVRVLAATHQDLELAIEAGRFRADLYYRLNVVSLYLPPLRDRGRDVQELARHFLACWNKATGETKSLSGAALALLGRYPWRGNVRELKNAVERLAMLALENTITPNDVDLWLGPPVTPSGMPLGQLSPPAFVCHLVAAVDELLARFRQEDQLPWPLPTDADLFEHVLEPLVLGRAMHAAQGDKMKAGLMFRGSRVDLSEKRADRPRMDRYENDLKPSIAEEMVAQLRGLPS
jgi:DNA-binding NtrC family response regulator